MCNVLIYIDVNVKNKNKKNHKQKSVCNRINKAKVHFLSSYSENMKLQNFIILNLSINSSDKGIGKDLYRNKNSLK